MANPSLLLAPLAMPITQPVPTQPPGLQGVATILGWTAWIVMAICLAAFIIAAGRIAMAYRNGEVEGAKGAVLAIVGSILVGGATAIFQAVG